MFLGYGMDVITTTLSSGATGAMQLSVTAGDVGIILAVSLLVVLESINMIAAIVRAIGVRGNRDTNK